MKISSFVSNSQMHNERLRETLNNIRDIRIQLVGEQPAAMTKSNDREAPHCILDETDMIVEIRDYLLSDIESEMSQINDALGDRFHPRAEDEDAKSPRV